VEGYYSIFKRGTKGGHQHCGEKALAPLFWQSSISDIQSAPLLALATKIHEGDVITFIENGDRWVSPAELAPYRAKKDRPPPRRPSGSAPFATD
jgi:hypothetical protein